MHLSWPLRVVRRKRRRRDERTCKTPGLIIYSRAQMRRAILCADNGGKHGTCNGTDASGWKRELEVFQVGSSSFHEFSSQPYIFSTSTFLKETLERGLGRIWTNLLPEKIYGRIRTKITIVFDCQILLKLNL